MSEPTPVGASSGPDQPAAALAILEALAAATPEPPPADAEPDEVLGQAEPFLAERERMLADLHAALARDPGALRGPGAIAVHAAIQERSAAWHAALSRARHLVGERVHAVTRLRRLTRR